MDRLLRGECTAADVVTLNKRVLNTVFRLPDGSLDKIGMKHCWMAQTITFRNRVGSIRLRLLRLVLLHEDCLTQLLIDLSTRTVPKLS